LTFPGAVDGVRGGDELIQGLILGRDRAEVDGRRRTLPRTNRVELRRPNGPRGVIRMARVALWVKAGRGRNSLEWDDWRKRWVVSCRAAPTHGEANRAVALQVADWLGVPHSAVRWLSAGASPAKVLWVEGITDPEAARRLREHTSH